MATRIEKKSVTNVQTNLSRNFIFNDHIEDHEPCTIYRLSYRLQMLINLLSVLALVGVSAADTCVKDSVSPCRCKSQNSGSVYDLSPLDKTPKQYIFHTYDKDGDKKYNYTYNPCTSYTWGTTGCTDVLMCQYYFGESTQVAYHPLGKADNVKFIGSPEDSNLQIHYTTVSSNADVTRNTFVDLKCGSDGPATFVGGDNAKGNYRFTLTTSLLCSKTHGISAGSVLLIIFFIAFPIYLIIGAVIKHFLMGATGMEMIPNYEFWCDLPLLVRDGMLFLFSGCKAETTYEKI